MAHAQKPDLVFQRNGRVHLNRREVSVQSTTGSRGVRISGQQLYRPCSDVQCKTTGYPLHSHLSPSLPLPCVTVCHQVPNALYILPSIETKHFRGYKCRLTLSDTHCSLNALQMFVYHAAAERMSLIHSSIQSVYGKVKDPAGGREPSCDYIHYQSAAIIIKTLCHSLHMQHIYREF